MTADQAILFVRAKRPNAIQTRVQLLCVREFTQFLIPLRNVFFCCEPKAHAVTLSQYLIRQRHLLHGYEARYLKHVPKLVHLVCKLLVDMAENRQVIEEELLQIPDLTAEIERTVSQLTVSQLEKGLDDGLRSGAVLGAGDAFMPHDPILSSEQEYDPLWKRRNVERLQPLSHLKKRLSYSDSDLTRAEFLLEQGETPWTVPAQLPFLRRLKQQSNARQCFVSSRSGSIHQTPPADFSRQSSVQSPFSFWAQSRFDSIEVQRDGSPLFHRRKNTKEIQRSRTFSLGCSSKANSTESDQSGHEFFSVPQCELPQMVELLMHSHVDATRPDSAFCGKDTSAFPDDEHITCQSECYLKHDFHDRGDAPDYGSRDTPEAIPHIVLQSELNLEARQLLALKALSGVREFMEEEEVEEKVKTWQKELNSREGAWDKICAERDPFILSGLMWSWIEQLKDPLLTKADVDMLATHWNEPHSALYLLEKGKHQTILCILNCVVSLQSVPADIEDAFFTRAIKAFTKVNLDSENGPFVYSTMKTLFHHVLADKRREREAEDKQEVA